MYLDRHEQRKLDDHHLRASVQATEVSIPVAAIRAPRQGMNVDDCQPTFNVTQQGVPLVAPTITAIVECDGDRTGHGDL